MQRVASASVAADEGRYAAIGPGMVVLLGIAPGDRDRESAWMSRKLAALRIFEDSEGKKNRSLRDTGGEALLVSQFTLYGDASRGNRPGFSGAARFEDALPVYERFVDMFEEEISRPVATGWYGADMQLTILNDGPVTLIIDTPTQP